MSRRAVEDIVADETGFMKYRTIELSSFGFWFASLSLFEAL